MANNQKPNTPEANGVKPEADINGNQSVNVKPAEDKPAENPDVAAQALHGSIKETTLQVSPIAESVDGKETGAAQSNRALHMSPAGALLDSAVDDRSRIREPRTPDRPGSIYDKNSFSAKVQYMNVGSEQAKAEITHAPTLQESSAQGTYSKSITFQEYSNKRRGQAPQSQLYFRSIDFEHTASEVVFSMGQLVDYNERNPQSPTGVVRRIQADQDYPSTRKVLNNNQVITETCPLGGTRGNYLLQGIEIDFSRDAQGREFVSGLRFNQTRIPVVKSRDSSKRINHNLEVETNIEAQRELKMINSPLLDVDSDKYNEFATSLGNERKPFFNLFSDIEGDTGFLAMMAYRFANMQYASINTKLAKSGSDESNVDLVKYFINNNIDFRTSLHTPNLDGLRIYNDVFNSHVNDNTLPMIPWYRYTQPSIRQFSNWSTLLTNKSTPKTLIDKAESVLESFFVKPESWNYLKNTQLYSNSDSSYNPNTPIVITPGYKVIVREDLNIWASTFNRDNANTINLSGTGNVFSQAWCQVDRKNVQVSLKHPFVDGLLYFLIDKEDEILSAFGGVDGIRVANGQAVEQGASTGTIAYNFDFTTDSFNPVCFLILAALPWMARIRNNNTYRIPRMWDEIGNPAEDHCVKCSASYALSSANFSIKDYAHAITLQPMSDVARIRYLYPERFTILDSANVENNVGNNGQIMARYYELPWYISEDSVNINDINNGMFEDDEQMISMNYPIFRRGLTHTDVSLFAKFSPRDLRFIMDQIVEIPRAHYNGITSLAGGTSTDYYPTRFVALRHDEYTSGRVILGYQSRNNNQHTTTSADYHDVGILFGDILSTPRELGFFAGYLPFTKTIVNGHDGCTLVYDADQHANVITFTDTLTTPVETVEERITAIQDAMGFAFGPDAQHRIISLFDLPIGAGVYGESYDLYWNEYDANDEEGLQIAAGYLQIYDRVYDLYTQTNNNMVALHNHEICLSLDFNLAPYDTTLHNNIHDIYLEDSLHNAQPLDFYYNGEDIDDGYLPYINLVTPSATRCLSTMLNITFKPYNYLSGIEAPRPIQYGHASTDPTVVIHSDASDHQVDLFEQAYYFNFVGFDATYYVNDINARDEHYNALNDGYLKDDWIEASLILK